MLNKKDILEKEITGEVVTVEIRGSVRPLAYPMHNVILYKQQTGDSLFDSKSWPRIDLQQDPERWLACLWAGLHEQQSDKSWKAPYTLEELGGLVDFSNAAAISIEMVKALTVYMPKAKEAIPNAAAPGTRDLPAQNDATMPVQISPSSGPAVVPDSVLAATSS
jgi:hypothetical protein